MGAAIAVVSVLTMFSKSPESSDVLAEGTVGQASEIDNGLQQDAIGTASERPSKSIMESGNSAKNFHEIASYKSNFEGNLVLHTMLQRADAKQLVEYLEATKSIDSTNRQQAVERAIVQRLAAISPQQALESIAVLPRDRHDDLVASVFEEWSHSSLDDAVAHAKSLEETNKLAAVRGILEARDDLSEDLRLQIARQLGNEQYALDLRNESIVSNLGLDPVEAWNSLLSDSQADISQLEAFLAVGRAMVDKEGLKALDTIRDSLGHSAVGNAVFLSAMHNAVQEDPQAAFQVASTMSTNNRRLALVSVVNSWALTDPMSALDAVNALKAGSLRNDMQEYVLLAWADHDPQSLYDNVERLPEGIRSEAEQQALLAIARTTPTEAVRFLASVTSDARRMDLAKEIARSWSETDSFAALEWALSEQYSDDQSRHNILSIVLGNLALDDPELALQTALNEPPGRYGRGLEVEVIQKVAQFDLDKAISMLAQVRDGPSKYSAYQLVGRALVTSGDYDRAIRLGEKLLEGEQSSYFSSVIRQWSHTDPQHLFDSLDRFPTQAVKTQAALHLLLANRRADIWDDEQLETLTAFVGDGSHFLTQDNPGRVVMLDGVSNLLVEGQLENHLSELQMKLEQTLSDAMTNIAIDGAFGGESIIGTSVIEVEKEESEDDSD